MSLGTEAHLSTHDLMRGWSLLPSYGGRKTSFEDALFQDVDIFANGLLLQDIATHVWSRRMEVRRNPTTGKASRSAFDWLICLEREVPKNLHRILNHEWHDWLIKGQMR